MTRPFDAPAGQLGNMAGVAPSRAVPADPVVALYCNWRATLEARNEAESQARDQAATKEADRLSNVLVNIERQIINTEANTLAGAACKLRIAIWFSEPLVRHEQGDDFGYDQRVALALMRDAVRVLDGDRRAAAASLPAAPQPHPDAELVRLCDEHIVNIHVYNSSRVTFDDCAQDPLWQAYHRTHEAISAARPRTMLGIVAKARAAKAEGRPRGDEPEDGVNGTAAAWGWDVVCDLLALADGAGRTPDASDAAAGPLMLGELVGEADRIVAGIEALAARGEPLHRADVAKVVLSIAADRLGIKWRIT